MRVVFFTDTYEPQINGVVTAIKLFEKELEKLGHEVYVVCPKTPGYNYRKNIFTLRSFTFKPYPEYRGALPSLKLLRWVKNINPDIIHVHTPVTIGLLGISTAKILSKPLIATYHTLMEEYFKIYFTPKRIGKKYSETFTKRFIRKYTKFFYNKADLITVPSLAIKKHLIKLGVEKPIIILPTGIDTEFFKPKGKPEKNTVLWVGRLGKEKSLDILLKAFGIVQKKIPKAKLVIIGDGPERKNLELLAEKLSLNAEFKGYVQREKLPHYYARAWLLASPSTTETQGLTILESFACACPVVVANALGFKDFVKHNYNGFFTKPKNIKDFAEKMIKLLENPSLRKKLSKNARKTAKEFSISKQTKKLADIYKNLSKSLPLVSVIIPALNEEKYIEKTLKSLKKQTYKKIEIIVVDNNSTDNTREIAKKYADKVIVERKRGVSIARNRGAREAKGEILIFVDADTCLEKNCIENLVKAYVKDKKIVCATGFVFSKGKLLYKIIYALTSLIAWFLSFIKPQFYGIIFSCKKNAFEKVKGFNENLITCEDIELTEKLAEVGKCKFIYKAKAFSSPRRLEKEGALKTVIFHILNYMKYRVFRKPSKNYGIVR